MGQPCFVFLSANHLKTDNNRGNFLAPQSKISSHLQDLSHNFVTDFSGHNDCCGLLLSSLLSPIIQRVWEPDFLCFTLFGGQTFYVLFPLYFGFFLLFFSLMTLLDFFSFLLSRMCSLFPLFKIRFMGIGSDFCNCKLRGENFIFSATTCNLGAYFIFVTLATFGVSENDLK